MDIISRTKWGARKPQATVHQTTWDKRDQFVVHYSAGPTNQTVKTIQAFHMDTNGWADIGYNFLVDQAGKIYAGRQGDWTAIGAHAANNNTRSIGVCFIGRNGDATDAARAAIRALYDEACRRAGRQLRQLGHRDAPGNATQCPGDDLHAWVHAGMPTAGGPPASDPQNWTERLVRTLPELRLGTTHTDAVRNWQSLLNVKGYGLLVDGDFGKNTDNATRRWQVAERVANSIRPDGTGDGIVGPASWAHRLGV